MSERLSWLINQNQNQNQTQQEQLAKSQNPRSDKVLDLTFGIIIFCMILGLRRDPRLFCASLIMLISMLIVGDWSSGVQTRIVQVLYIDLFFCLLFFVGSNVIYGLLMSVLLTCNSILGILFYFQYETGGGWFYSEYENLNLMISFCQAVGLLIVGTINKQWIGADDAGIFRRFYDVRLTVYPALRPVFAYTERVLRRNACPKDYKK